MTIDRVCKFSSFDYSLLLLQNNTVDTLNWMVYCLAPNPRNTNVAQVWGVLVCSCP